MLAQSDNSDIDLKIQVVLLPAVEASEDIDHIGGGHLIASASTAGYNLQVRGIDGLHLDEPMGRTPIGREDKIGDGRLVLRMHETEGYGPCLVVQGRPEEQHCRCGLEIVETGQILEGMLRNPRDF